MITKSANFCRGNPISNTRDNESSESAQSEARNLQSGVTHSTQSPLWMRCIKNYVHKWYYKCINDTNNGLPAGCYNSRHVPLF